MSRISASLPGFELRIVHQLNRLNRAIDQNNLRLSTLKRINSAADDPSGLVFVGSQRSELTSIQALLANVEKVQGVVDFADTSLEEVATHLDTIRTAALEAAGGSLTQAELEANQDEIDTAVEAINSLSRSELNGRRLLDGSRDYVVSGVNTSEVRSLTVFNRNTAAASQTLAIDVTTQATQAQLTYTGAAGLVLANAELTITGATGAASFDVTAAETLTAVRDRINDESYATGVTASVSGNDLILKSAGYGTDATIAVEVTSGTFNVTGGNGDGTAEGIDAEATVNGTALTADGLKLRYRSSSLDADVELDPAVATGLLDTITVSGQALSFQITNLLTPSVPLSLPSIHSARLGGLAGKLSEVATGGGTSLLDGDYSTLIRIVDEAQSQILSLQARVGSFTSSTLDSVRNVLEGQEESLTDSIASVEDADIAVETALLARHEFLADNAAAALVIASDRNSFVLQFLQQLAFGL